MPRAPTRKDLFIATSKYFMSSYLYYVRDVSIWSDAEYDSICKYLLQWFDRIEHPHKEYLSKSALKAGTGFDFKWRKMPLIIPCSAVQWYNESQSHDCFHIDRPRISVIKKKKGKKDAKNKTTKRRIEREPPRGLVTKKPKGFSF